MPGDCPFDLGRSDRDPVSRLEHRVAAARLAIDPDQIVRWLALRQSLVEELLHGGAVRDVDVVSEAAAVVVDEEHSHGLGFLLVVERRRGFTTETRRHGGTEKQGGRVASMRVSLV